MYVLLVTKSNIKWVKQYIRWMMCKLVAQKMNKKAERPNGVLVLTLQQLLSL